MDPMLWCIFSNNQEVANEEEYAALTTVLLLQGRTVQPLQTYLTRLDLAPDPMTQSAWAFLRRAQNNRSFITTMGVDVQTFNFILSHFEPMWLSSTISRSDVSAFGEPQFWRRSLDAGGCLGLLLHWLNSTMPEISLQQIFALTPAVCSRYIHHGLDLLLQVLHHIPEAQIKWPHPNDFQRYSRMIEAKYPLLTGCFGFVDGLNLPVMVSGDDDIQNAYYNGWTCAHYCSNVLAFAPDGTLISADLNAPGSWHDAVVAQKLYNKLLYKTPPGYRILSDTAFPRKATWIQDRILAPIKEGDNLPTNTRAYARLITLNRQVVSARQAAEWGMRSIQGSFGRLKMPLPASDHAGRVQILEVVCRLHQLRCRIVGINQIRSVYGQVWAQDEGASGQSFQQMTFREIQGSSRIARFYHNVV